MFATFLAFTKSYRVWLLVAAMILIFGAGWKVSSWKSEAALLKASQRHAEQVQELREQLLQEHEAQALADQQERNRLAKAVAQLREKEHELTSQIHDLDTTGCASNPINDDFIRLWNAPLEQ